MELKHLMLCLIIGFTSGFLTQNGDTDAFSGNLTAQIKLLDTRLGYLEEQYRCACKVFMDCPDGWTKYNGSCYYFGVKPEIWQNAEDKCERLGGHLADVESMEEERFIEEFIKMSRNMTLDLSHGYTWLGGYDFLVEGKWLWVTGRPLTYTNWRASNPSNNVNGEEDCLDYSFGGWNDNHCTAKLNYVCERKAMTL